MDDKYGALTFTRIYSGKLTKGMSVLNTATGKSERIGRIIEMHADERTEIDSAQAGDIVALLGMKSVQTGHTLCDPANGDSGAHGIPRLIGHFDCGQTEGSRPSRENGHRHW